VASGYRDGTVNAMPVGEDATRDRRQTRERRREKDKHPFDHHYEMKTINSDQTHVQRRILGGVEDTEENEQVPDLEEHKAMLLSGELSLGGDLPGVITIYSSHSLDRSLFLIVYMTILRSLRELRRTRVIWLTLCVIFR
jgi:hypothetical protein